MTHRRRGWGKEETYVETVVVVYYRKVTIVFDSKKKRKKASDRDARLIERRRSVSLRPSLSPFSEDCKILW
ncbi:hypothetical protein Bca4012_056010 [Brassica carinata]